MRQRYPCASARRSTARTASARAARPPQNPNPNFNPSINPEPNPNPNPNTLTLALALALTATFTRCGSAFDTQLTLMHDYPSVDFIADRSRSSADFIAFADDDVVSPQVALTLAMTLGPTLILALILTLTRAAAVRRPFSPSPTFAPAAISSSSRATLLAPPDASS